MYALVVFTTLNEGSQHETGMLYPSTDAGRQEILLQRLEEEKVGSGEDSRSEYYTVKARLTVKVTLENLVLIREDGSSLHEMAFESRENSSQNRAKATCNNFI